MYNGSGGKGRWWGVLLRGIIKGVDERSDDELYEV